MAVGPKKLGWAVVTVLAPLLFIYFAEACDTYRRNQARPRNAAMRFAAAISDQEALTGSPVTSLTQLAPPACQSSDHCMFESSAKAAEATNIKLQTRDGLRQVCVQDACEVIGRTTCVGNHCGGVMPRDAAMNLVNDAG